MKTFLTLSTLAALALIANPAIATEKTAKALSISESKTYESDFEQSGSLTNVQVNNSITGRFSAYGHECSTPSLGISGFAADQGHRGITGTLTIPLGGQTGKLCRQAIQENLKQSQAQTCITLLNAGISVNYEKAPEFAFCEAFSKTR